MTNLRTILFTLLVTTTTITSTGQVTDSITDKNKVWYNTIYIYMMEWVDTEVLGLGNDTTINDTIYSSVLRSRGGVEVPYQEYGFLRSDSGQVFYKSYADIPERLLYDFTISEGDTVTAYGLINKAEDYFFECHFICDSIRERTYYNVDRSVFYLYSIDGEVGNIETWIEGIGSLSGLLHNYDGRVGADAFYLACVKDQDGFLFKRVESEPCIKIALGMEENQSPSPAIYPNPIDANSTLFLRVATPHSMFELYDAYGRLVFVEKVKSETASFKINLSNGCYIFRVRSKDGISKQGKLMVR